nr:hypothetical protein BaRGS_020719 [Batillaria attramentaria]
MGVILRYYLNEALSNNVYPQNGAAHLLDSVLKTAGIPDNNSFSSPVGHAGLALIMVGILLTVVSLCGGFGAGCENPTLLLAFVVVSCVIFIGEAIVFAELLPPAQSAKCCGVEGPGDFKNLSLTYAHAGRVDKVKVPLACCNNDDDTDAGSASDREHRILRCAIYGDGDDLSLNSSKDKIVISIFSIISIIIIISSSSSMIIISSSNSSIRHSSFNNYVKKAVVDDIQTGYQPQGENGISVFLNSLMGMKWLGNVVPVFAMPTKSEEEKALEAASQSSAYKDAMDCAAQPGKNGLYPVAKVS